MLFDTTEIGSPVTASQWTELAWECDRILREVPSTASFTYLGPQGLTSSIKNTDEYSYSAAIPVPAVVCDVDATCHVLLSPIVYRSATDDALLRSTLGWRIDCRSIDGTAGVFATEQVTPSWINYGSSDWFAFAINSCSFPVTFGATANYRYTGAFIATRLLGDWGYAGNLPNFVAFCTL